MDFGTEKTWKILLKLAPPIMIAQLIQAMYNIVDSYFIGQYSTDGLTALSVIYPLQLLIGALAIGTGVGVNTIMAKFYGLKHEKEADETAGVGTVLALLTWLAFAIISLLIMGPYTAISSSSKIVQSEAIAYGNIVCGCSFAIFLESMWTKIHQAGGNMKTPMFAQVAGAITNIILDPIFIFGWGIIPAMGIKGAAYATITGQIIAAIITGRKAFKRIPPLSRFANYVRPIYKAGVPNIIMQASWTLYIVGLNVILAGFSDAAVTVLGLYYKIQTFFFIPLEALGVCIVPILSFNYAINRIDRCKKVFWQTIAFSIAFMLIAVAAFEFVPVQMIGIFSKELEVAHIGATAFRIIALSFIPTVFALTLPVYFQAIGAGVKSIIVTVLRQVVLLAPLAFIFSFIGLEYVWLTFPITEIITTAVGMVLYYNCDKKILFKDRSIYYGII